MNLYISNDIFCTKNKIYYTFNGKNVLMTLYFYTALIFKKGKKRYKNYFVIILTWGYSNDLQWITELYQLSDIVVWKTGVSIIFPCTVK